MPPDRRVVLAAAAGALAGLGLPRAVTAQPAPAAGADTELWLKLVADLSGRPTFSVVRGDVWGFRAQADDLSAEDFAKRLYGYWSLSARRVKPAPQGGFALTQQSWSFYTDAATGAVTDRVWNPYRKVEVRCPPLSGPPSNTFVGAGAPASGTPELRRRSMADRTWLTLSRISRFKPKDTTWFKLEADLTDYAVSARDLANARLTHIPNTWSHNVVAEWQTWMGMHGEPGHILFKGEGAQAPTFSTVDPALRAAIDRFFPAGAPDRAAAWG